MKTTIRTIGQMLTVVAFALNLTTAKAIVGGYQQAFTDDEDMPGCVVQGGSTCNSCKQQPGMPVWSVSEPYINLWLQDIPFRYQPAKGPEVAFKLNYQQREGSLVYASTNEFSFGSQWN